MLVGLNCVSGEMPIPRCITNTFGQNSVEMSPAVEALAGRSLSPCAAPTLDVSD